MSPIYQVLFVKYLPNLILPQNHKSVGLRNVKICYKICITVNRILLSVTIGRKLMTYIPFQLCYLD